MELLGKLLPSLTLLEELGLGVLVLPRAMVWGWTSVKVQLREGQGIKTRKPQGEVREFLRVIIESPLLP